MRTPVCFGLAIGLLVAALCLGNPCLTCRPPVRTAPVPAPAPAAAPGAEVRPEAPARAGAAVPTATPAALAVVDTKAPRVLPAVLRPELTAAQQDLLARLLRTLGPGAEERIERVASEDGTLVVHLRDGSILRCAEK